MDSYIYSMTFEHNIFLHKIFRIVNMDRVGGGGGAYGRTSK